jgi:predicted ribosome quality control (RQC) complex YloA/Tae2 family protein
MARAGVTREQVFETADALVREGQNPTVVAVRTRLGGGSPNTITPLLAEWKALHEHKQAASVPAPPEPVEAVMRQVWGTAWQQAQDQLAGEREALAAARKEIGKEREAMLAEIARMDADLETARDTIRERDEALEAERRAHEQTASEAREVRALAGEREKRITGQDRELAELRGRIEALRIEAATLTERASHVDELRAMFKTLQEQQGRGEATAKPRAAAKRRSRPEG